jgi:hypothetical protein
MRGSSTVWLAMPIGFGVPVTNEPLRPTAFAAADQQAERTSGGAALLFDEAYTLFGRRSDEKDGIDRYANMDVNYLFRRTETHPGIAILSTNKKKGDDNVQ